MLNSTKKTVGFLSIETLFPACDVMQSRKSSDASNVQFENRDKLVNRSG